MIASSRRLGSCNTGMVPEAAVRLHARLVVHQVVGESPAASRRAKLWGKARTETSIPRRPPTPRGSHDLGLKAGNGRVAQTNLPRDFVDSHPTAERLSGLFKSLGIIQGPA